MHTKGIPIGLFRRRAITIVSLILAAALALPAAGVLAVHDEGLFELGNGVNPPVTGSADIVGSGAQAGPDWDDLFDATPTQAEIDAAVASFGGVAGAFIKDDLAVKGPLDSTTFSGAGGSNKNNDPIFGPGDTWHWDAGNVPAKDDLSNVYAYGTFNPANNHLIFYAGFERLDPSGDSHVDIEFLQDNVSLDEAVPCNDPGPDVTPCSFTGGTTNGRTDGDIIISMDFTQGGGIGSITVHRFDGATGVYAEPPIISLGGEGCNPVTGTIDADSICAFNNGGTIDGGDWPNFDRGGDVITNLSANAFTEFGIDVTEVIGGDECITTVMGKTRSSQSFTAELKDFAGPQAFSICGANISIETDDTNEVGQSHTFTVNVNKELGQLETPAPDGTIVDVTLTDANGAVNTISNNTCASPGTVGGTCSVTFTSNTPGTVTGHAAADVVVGGQTIHVETDGSGSNSGDAVKTFVDAFITIATDDTNSVGESHTFVVTVKQNAGDGAGFVNAPDGTKPTVTLTDSGGAVNQISSNTCANPGTSGGTCSVTFTSNTAGTVTGHASVTFSVGGLSLTRETNGSGQNSDDAVKTFVAGSLAWLKKDNAGNLQGGATFEVCRTHNFNSADGTFTAITPVCVTVTDNSSPDADADAGEFLLTGLRLGRYTVDETVAPPGFEPDPSVKTADLTLASPNATISVAFVNQRPILKLTAFGYTNEPTGTPTGAIVSGSTTYTVKFKNFGGATTTLSGQLAVSVAGAGGGSLTCTGGNTLSISGSLAPNQETTSTLTCAYTNLAAGAVVTADLTGAGGTGSVTYTTNGLTRNASGTPASISFTIPADVVVVSANSQAANNSIYLPFTANE